MNFKFKSKHILIVISIMLIGLLLGSFFDLQIAEVLYCARHPFWVFWTAIFSVIIDTIALSFFGASLFPNIYRNKKMPKFVKFIFYFMGIGMIVSGWYIQQSELNSVSGYNFQGAFKLIGYFVSFIVIIPSSIVGYKVGKKITMPNYWFIVGVIAFIFVVPAFGFTKILKVVFHRVRYRALVTYESSLTLEHFHNWWEPFSNYKDYITNIITEEEFKSFPSGHACYGSLPMVISAYFPYVFQKMKKYQVPMFYCSFVFYLITSFARLRLGAHFLSDVSMGGLLIIITFLFANMVVNNNQEFILKTFDEEVQ